MNSDPFAPMVLDFYRRAATRYDSWAGGANARAADRLAELAAVAPHERVLDVGCGTGLVTHRLGCCTEDSGRLGIDLSPHMIAIARQRATELGGAGFAVMNAHDLLLRDGAVDVVVLGQSLAYLADPWRGLAEIRRVLRPGGRIVVSARCRSLSTPAQNLFFNRLERLAIRLPRTPDHHALFGEPWVLADMLRTAGFASVEITQMLVGTHAVGVHEWTEMMRLAGPWPHAMMELLSPAARATFEENLDRAMHQLGEGDYAFHGAFTFALAQRA